MPAPPRAVQEFLEQKRFAVVGVTRNRRNEPGNLVYRKLRDAGYEVFPVNPGAREVEGVPCHPDLESIPGGVDGVVVTTAPAVTEAIARDCARLGIGKVWMHRSFGGGSVSEEAVAFCRGHGIDVIPGGCPMMYCGPVDWGHRCMRWILGVTGRLPRDD